MFHARPFKKRENKVVIKRDKPVKKHSLAFLEFSLRSNERSVKRQEFERRIREKEIQK